MDRDSIEFDEMSRIRAEIEEFEISSVESALEQCIYLFVEGESEEAAFRIILEEGLNINFNTHGIVIANYRGIANLGNCIRLMQNTLSHSRPMIFTFDDDDRKIINKIGLTPPNVHLFKIPSQPIVIIPDGSLGGSFEESFHANDFINACFEKTLLKKNTQVKKQEFARYFDIKKPFYNQIVQFLQ